MASGKTVSAAKSTDLGLKTIIMGMGRGIEGSVMVAVGTEWRDTGLKIETLWERFQATYPGIQINCGRDELGKGETLITVRYPHGGMLERDMISILEEIEKTFMKPADIVLRGEKTRTKHVIAPDPFNESESLLP